MLYNNNIIAHNHHTHNVMSVNIYIYNDIRLLVPTLSHHDQEACAEEVSPTGHGQAQVLQVRKPLSIFNFQFVEIWLYLYIVVISVSVEWCIGKPYLLILFYHILQ